MLGLILGLIAGLIRTLPEPTTPARFLPFLIVLLSNDRLERDAGVATSAGEFTAQIEGLGWVDRGANAERGVAEPDFFEAG